MNPGTGQSFSITPNAGCRIEDVEVDGVSVGVVPTYTFTNVTADHTISAIFKMNLPNISVSPTSKDFGSVKVGVASTTQTFTVSNTGDANLVIGTITITGTNASEFTKSSDNCSGQTKAPSSSCSVQVVFSPTSAGAKSANLSIPSNDPDTPTLNVPLSGTGVNPQLTVTKTGTGTGTVSSSPAGINCGTDCTELYNRGTVVTLIAMPDANSLFASWAGGGCSGTGSCTITLNADTAVTATFNTIPPVAQFSASPTTGSVPLIVSFTDSSTYNPTSWSWNFGDTTTDTVKNPTHIYRSPGTYTVSLTASNAGGSNTNTKTNYITVQPCPNLPVRIAGTTPVYYSTLQAAYNAAGNGAVIQSQALRFTENFTVNQNITVTLEGGYNCDYATNSGGTTLIKGMITTTVGGGTMTIKNFILEK